MERASTMGTRHRGQCVALIGDIVKSRKLDGGRRYSVQQRLSSLLEEFNQVHQRSIISQFVVTLGDEFQGLLKSPQIIPDLLWQLESDLTDVQVRIGAGYGTLTTPIQDEAIGMDGPAFHNARAAITEAKSRGHLGGVFKGFQTPANEALNGFARILYRQRVSWTDTQREVVEFLRRGIRQSGIATELDITQQAVSSRTRSSGWQAYTEAEHGWRVMLTQFDSATDWEDA